MDGSAENPEAAVPVVVWRWKRDGLTVVMRAVTPSSSTFVSSDVFVSSSCTMIVPDTTIGLSTASSKKGTVHDHCIIIRYIGDGNTKFLLAFLLLLGRRSLLGFLLLFLAAFRSLTLATESVVFVVFGIAIHNVPSKVNSFGSLDALSSSEIGWIKRLGGHVAAIGCVHFFVVGPIYRFSGMRRLDERITTLAHAVTETSRR
mmetsp:Transcript_21949/g.54231  ORF Transcript_21949/g.54231 Transcript_21949/m.54231 type:complete len:202 (-) Transcript_21949:287-892(-)